MSALVELLSTKKALLRIDGLVSAWECVIKFQFKNASKTRSHEQDSVLSKGLFLFQVSVTKFFFKCFPDVFLLQSCPLSSKLNVMEYVETFIRLERPHMAAIFIPFSNDAQKTEIISVLYENV